jgi:hypothetical protein
MDAPRVSVRRKSALAFDSGADRSYVGGVEQREQNPTVDLLDRLFVGAENTTKGRFNVPFLSSR